MQDVYLHPVDPRRARSRIDKSEADLTPQVSLAFPLCKSRLVSRVSYAQWFVCSPSFEIISQDDSKSKSGAEINRERRNLTIR